MFLVFSHETPSLASPSSVGAPSRTIYSAASPSKYNGPHGLHHSVACGQLTQKKEVFWLLGTICSIGSSIPKSRHVVFPAEPTRILPAS